MEIVEKSLQGRPVKSTPSLVLGSSEDRRRPFRRVFGLATHLGLKWDQYTGPAENFDAATQKWTGSSYSFTMLRRSPLGVASQTPLKCQMLQAGLLPIRTMHRFVRTVGLVKPQVLSSRFDD